MRAVGFMAVVVIGVGVAAILFFVDPCQADYLPGCLFHAWTGLYCPGCGSTRALHALMHGHLDAALRFNPLAILAIPGLTALAVWRQRTLPPFVGWSTVTLVFLFGILRNIPLEIFAVLRP